MEAEPDLVDGSVGIRFGPNPARASVRCGAHLRLSPAGLSYNGSVFYTRAGHCL
jgi:hypothetical protein